LFIIINYLSGSIVFAGLAIVYAEHLQAGKRRSLLQAVQFWLANIIPLPSVYQQETKEPSHLSKNISSMSMSL
jgi:hypothetical protein